MGHNIGNTKKNLAFGAAGNQIANKNCFDTKKNDLKWAEKYKVYNMLACDGIHHNSPVFIKNRVRNGRKIWKPALLFCKLGNPEQLGKTKNNMYILNFKKKILLCTTLSLYISWSRRILRQVHFLLLLVHKNTNTFATAT